MVTNSPYGDKSQVVKDIPALSEQDDNDLDRYNIESSAEIDDMLFRMTTVPLVGTIPQSIVTATNNRIKAKYFMDSGEPDRAVILMKLSDNGVQNYALTLTHNNPMTGGEIVVVESDYLSSELSGQ